MFHDDVALHTPTYLYDIFHDSQAGSFRFEAFMDRNGHGIELSLAGVLRARIQKHVMNVPQIITH